MEIPVTVEFIDDMGNLDYIDDVLIEGFPHWEDSSYSDAYGLVKINAQPMLDEDVSWNKTLYSTFENEKIKQWVDTHNSLLDDIFCKQLVKDSEPDY